MGKARKWLSGYMAALVCGASAGCYHFTFEQRERPLTAGLNPSRGAPREEVTYQRRESTYLAGFVGNGRIDTTLYCARPIRTELKVTPTDALLSAVTLLIYTPHTLYVTCEAPTPLQ